MPSDEAVRCISMFLPTTFARNSDVRLIDACVEVPAQFNIQVPQKIMALREPGGDGKFVRTHLR